MSTSGEAAPEVLSHSLRERRGPLLSVKSMGFHGDPTETPPGSIRIRNEPSEGSGAGEGVRTLDPYLGKIGADHSAAGCGGSGRPVASARVRSAAVGGRLRRATASNALAGVVKGGARFGRARHLRRKAHERDGVRSCRLPY